MSNPLGISATDTVLVVHAHPDDESVACGTLIRQLTQDDITVHAVIATDGKKSTKGDSNFVASGQRRHEAEAAYKILGVPLERQHYFGLPDGELSQNKDKLLKLFIALMQQYGITTIITPGADGFDGHPDHIAVHETAYAAKALLQKPMIIWALHANDTGTAVIPVDTAQKLIAIAEHHSQFPTHRAADGTIILAEATAADFAMSPYNRLVYKEETYSRVA
jgi:LmbE family N-acetylglucosaminyl deacetylase